MMEWNRVGDMTQYKRARADNSNVEYSMYVCTYVHDIGEISSKQSLLSAGVSTRASPSTSSHIVHRKSTSLPHLSSFNSLGLDLSHLSLTSPAWKGGIEGTLNGELEGRRKVWGKRHQKPSQ